MFIPQVTLLDEIFMLSPGIEYMLEADMITGALGAVPEPSTLMLMLVGTMLLRSLPRPRGSESGTGSRFLTGGDVELRSCGAKPQADR